MSLLDLSEVTVGYSPESTTLESVSLTVGAGEVVALLGPNGAGKTTVLRTASGMLKLRQGSVNFDGADATTWPAHVMTLAGLCHVPEGRGIFPALSVRDNLSLFGHGMSASEAVDRAVDAFPFISTRLEIPAGKLSGGERQMLSLVRSWLVEPKLVLLDEVSMGLAPLIVDDVYAFIEKLAERGTAILIVEQYVERVRQVADRVYILRNGRIAFDGPTSELGSAEEILGHYLGEALDAS